MFNVHCVPLIYLLHLRAWLTNFSVQLRNGTDLQFKDCEMLEFESSSGRHVSRWFRTHTKYSLTVAFTCIEYTCIYMYFIAVQ